MGEDIRDKAWLVHEDVAALNFIRDSERYLYRRHFRNGLRSHIMEVLDADQVKQETRGRVVDGVRIFSKAVPRRMLRIFRTRLASIEQALNEIVKLRVIETFLAGDQFAGSSEFIVDYAGPDGPDILLCGLQAFVEGRKLDPWQLNSGGIYKVYAGMDATDRQHFSSRLQKNARRFVAGVQQMIQKAGYIPDLAGQRNLLVAPDGGICLVDINNVSPVRFSPRIFLDDKGYPVCDKSMEALSLIDCYLCGNAHCPDEFPYRVFLEPGRMREVAAMDAAFHRSLRQGRESFL